MKTHIENYLEGSHSAESSKLRPAQTCAIFSIIGYSYFLVAIIALHFLRPNLNPMTNSVSEYAIGPYGWLITTSIVAVGVSTLALALGLFWGEASKGWSRIGLILLCLGSTGAIIAGFFTTVPDGAPPTVSGTMHFLASLIGFSSLVAGILLQTRHFKQDENWHIFYPTLWRLALLILILFLGYLLTYMSDFSGLTERIFIASTMPWLILTDIHLYSVSTQGASSQSSQ